MRYRRLGALDLEVSEISLGTMVFGWRTSPEEAYLIIDRAIESGINLIDTSNSYGRGRSETIVGDALDRNGKRKKILLATKFHVTPSTNGTSEFEQVIEQCDKSLQRLRTDYIDLYQVHGPISGRLSEGAIGALDQLVRVGKIRNVGSSNLAGWQIADARTRMSAGSRIVCEQAPYNMLDRSIEANLFPDSKMCGLGVIAWSPLAEGILAGKYRRDESLPDDSRYAKVDKPGLYRERLTPSVFSVVEAVERRARTKNVSLAAYALAWVLKRPEISAVLVGPRTQEQLETSLMSQEVTLTAEDMRMIDTIAAPGSVISPYAAPVSMAST